MKNTLKLLLLICFTGFNCMAQNEASTWFFGFNSGIKFNQTSNTISSLNDGALSTFEGCATISDGFGDLLFYTDGIRVWNKNHNIMNNGLGLYGDPSSTQSAIIVPKPNDDNIYYIFTVDDHGFNEIHLGLNYSIVDMTLDGGLGSITNKNINLLQECSEKITAVVKDCKSKSIWVLAFASEAGNLDIYNTYHAFQVDDSGVSLNSIPSIFPLNVTDERGYLKLSPDGTKMASANSGDGMYLYDFDTNTGMVSNQQTLFISGQNNKPYGVEFSPNSELLYVHSSNDFFDFQNPSNNNILSNHRSLLIQYNLLSTDIQNSAVIIDDRQLYRGGLQLGPDGKIYRALSATYNQGLPFLGVINNPNELGLESNYQHNAINLSPNTSSQGLPPFITSFFAQKLDIIQNSTSTSTSLQLCDGDSYTLEAPNYSGATYIWTFNDSPLPDSDFNFDIEPDSPSGIYKVFIDLNTGDCNDLFEGFANVSFQPNPIAYDAELTQCDEDGVLGGFTRFNLNQANENLTGGISNLSTRFFTDASRDNDSEILNADNYNYDADNPNPIYVEVFNTDTNCYDTSELTLNLSLQKIAPFLYPVCDELNSEDGINAFNLSDITTSIQSDNGFTYPITYYKTQDDALLEENNLENTSYTNTDSRNSETIYARVENDNACFGIAEVILQVNRLPDINVEDLTYYCTNFYPKTITINAGLNSNNVDHYFYLWSNNDSGYETPINEAGTYTVTVTHKITGCTKERTVIVNPSNSAVFNSENPFEVKDASQNNTITVFVSGDGTYQYKLLDENENLVAPYQDSNIFENVKPGIYKVLVNDISNDCGEVNKNVSVIGFPKYFTPNNDGINDTWQIIGVSDMFQPNSKVLIFNRFGKLIKEISPLGEGWNGHFNGEILPADDYWFSVKLQDGRIFKSHFTLKY